MMKAENSEAQYDDRPVAYMLYPSIFFMIFGMLTGVFISFNGFLSPDYFSGEYVHFGRVRPVHVSSVLVLWLLSAGIGLFYYFVPRLSGISIWSEKLSRFQAGFWWTGWIIGIFSYFGGTNFGWEYAELPYFVGWIPVKLFVTISFILLAINIFMTVANRRFEKIYVSLWYTMGTLIWGIFTWIVGAYGIDWVPYGISRVNVSFFYIHNLVGLIFTPMGLAAAYYFLPKAANVPIYSHKLSMIGFWTIAFTYGWIGAHHIIHGPMSQWLQTVAIIFSIWLFIPVFTVVANLFATLHGHWDRYVESIPVRFIVMGTMFYFITCVQGPLMALRNVNEITSKTDWIIGHSHVSLYATFSFFAMAGIYVAIPAITKKKLWSNKLAEWHFNLNIIGSVPFILALWLGGFLQGMLWATWANGSSYAEYHNNLANLTFLDTVSTMYIWWLFRTIGGIIITFANILFVINIYNTIVLKERE